MSMVRSTGPTTGIKWNLSNVNVFTQVHVAKVHNEHNSHCVLVFSLCYLVDQVLQTASGIEWGH